LGHYAEIHDVAALLICYRRPDNVRKILNHISESGIRKIYVSLDGFKNESGRGDYVEIEEIIKEFAAIFPGQLYTRFLHENVGCAVSVISACNWVFSQEEYAIILEDDCFPNSDFFNFVLASIPVMTKDESIWLACGTQFAPKEITASKWVISQYALTWGWATTAKKWSEIAPAFTSEKKIPVRPITYSAESIYWSEGARRALFGFVDVWDTILLWQMNHLNKKAILPGEPLISNKGNDASATHTTSESQWLNLSLGRFEGGSLPQRSKKADQWLKISSTEFLFGI
jgi:GR25 family glycosyltransferase involved in LPS biosynthesis